MFCMDQSWCQNLWFEKIANPESSSMMFKSKVEGSSPNCAEKELKEKQGETNLLWCCYMLNAYGQA